MILSDKINDVYTCGIGDIEQFKFTNSPVIFKILSDSLYSDKISSIIRELSCNARDSHVAAGNKDVPFDIHLPVFNKKSLFHDKTESYFSVKDYGVGLSEKEIYELYTVYGESNKRKSNEFVGGFGIGSKSPFAYTDCFTVISRYEGIKTTYSAFVDESGYPSITKVYEETTEECNGVEVSFLVKETDVEKFIVGTNRELQFFNPYPNINNDVCSPFIKENITDEGKNWFIQKSYNSNSLKFIIGNVSYDVDSDYYNKFWMGTLYIYCDIGSISLSASRETLAYTSKTKKMIEDKLLSIQNEIIFRLLKYKNEHTKYEYLSYMNILPYLYKYFDKNLYKDIISDYIRKIDLPINEFNRFLSLHKSDIHIYSYGKLKKFDKSITNYYIDINSNVKFIYFTKKYYMKDISAYIENRNEYKNSSCVITVRYSDKNSISDINNKFFNPSYKLVDELIKEEIKNKEQKVGFKVINLSVYNQINSSIMGNFIEDDIKNVVNFMKDKKFILLYERNNFLGDEDWTFEQRTNFCIKFTKIYNIWANAHNDSKVEVILLNKKNFNILKKYGVTLTSYHDCYEELKNFVIQNLKLTEDIMKYSSIYSSYVYKILNYIKNNFSREEIIQYKEKNMLFDLIDKLWTVVSNKTSEKIFYVFSNINIDKNVNNVYNSYILSEPILRLLNVNYVDKEVKSCLIKYLNLN